LIIFKTFSMKQLVFYFMFFVGASLILVQCAKLFPSVQNSSGINPESNFIKKTAVKKQVKSSAIADVLSIEAGMKNNMVWPLFSNPVFNYNVFASIKPAHMFDQPYINLAYAKFVREFQSTNAEEKQ
jgi:hypothetical protein